MTRFISSAVVLGLGLAMLPGCPLLDIQADVPEVCLTYPNLQVPGVVGTTSIMQSFVFDDLSRVHDIAKQEADLEFVRAEIRATSGISDFSFIHAVHVTVESGDPGSTLPPLTMYDCSGDCAPEGNKIDLPAAFGNNAIDYLRSDSILVGLAFEGHVPEAAWTMDVDVCMRAKASYTVSP